MTTKQVSKITRLSTKRITQWARGVGKQKPGRDYDFTWLDVKFIEKQKDQRGRPKRDK